MVDYNQQHLPQTAQDIRLQLHPSLLVQPLLMVTKKQCAVWIQEKYMPFKLMGAHLEMKGNTLLNILKNWKVTPGMYLEIYPMEIT